jgi:hypothetical protein
MTALEAREAFFQGNNISHKSWGNFYIFIVRYKSGDGLVFNSNFEEVNIISLLNIWAEYNDGWIIVEKPQR